MPPYNGSGNFSVYTPGNPAITGTSISSTAFNNTMNDFATGLSTALTKDGQTPATGNIPLGGNKVTGLGNGTARTDAMPLGQEQDGTALLITGIAGTNTITGNLTPAITAYVAGQAFRFISAGANTGAATININGLGAKAITKSGATALSSGDIPAGAAVTIIYDGTQFQLEGGSSLLAAISVDASQNVGVNTTTPTSGLQTAGSSSKSAFKTPNIAEVNTVSATAATGTVQYNITTQSVLYYTTNASGNFTVNFRGSSGTSLNTVMQTGESISVTFLVTNGSTAYYNSAVTIDGFSVTPKWQGGTAPTSGNASSIDSYNYVIIKTGSAAFTVLASVTKFA